MLCINCNHDKLSVTVMDVL